MSEPRALKPTVIAAIAVALLVASIGWFKTLRRADWLSAPHRLTWTARDGRPLGEDFNCDGDINFAALVDGERAWVLCRASSAGARPFLGFIDPGGGVARAIAELPPDATWTTGVLPGPNHTIAIVVAVKSGLVLGIANREGWVREPTPLPGGGPLASVAGLLGMSYRGEVLEVAICPTPASDPQCWSSPLTIVRYAPGNAATERAIPRSALQCSGFCQPIAAYRRGNEETWRLIARASNDQVTGLVDAAEDGTFIALALEEPNIRSQLDATYFGLISRPIQPSFVLFPDGHLELERWFRGWSTHFTVDGGRARVLANNYQLGPPQRVEHDIPGRTLRTALLSTGDAHTPVYGDPRLSIVDATNPNAPSETIVARLHDCTGLATNGLFLPRPGGFFLIEPSGCFVTLDSKLRRVDPHGLLTHLRTRGSMYIRWNEPSHSIKLFFVLFGLPLALAIAFVVHRRWRKPLPTALVVAAWGYSAIGAWLLSQLWPILR